MERKGSGKWKKRKKGEKKEGKRKGCVIAFGGMDDPDTSACLHVACYATALVKINKMPEFYVSPRLTH